MQTDNALDIAIEGSAFSKFYFQMAELVIPEMELLHGLQMGL